MTDAATRHGLRPAPSRASLNGKIVLGNSSSLPWPVLIYLITVVFPLGVRVGPLVMTGLRTLLLLFLIPLLVRLFTGQLGGLLVIDILFILHILWGVVALAMNNPDQVVQQSGSVGLEFLGGYLIGRAYVRTPEAFTGTARMLALVVCCILPFALLESLTFRPMLIELLRSTGSLMIGVINAGERMGMRRAQASFAHPIHYGLFCSVAFSLTFVALTGTFGKARRYITAMLIAFAGFLALSSGALLAIALQISLIAWSTALARVKSRWWILVGLFALAYVIIDLLSNRAPLQVFMSYATFSPHNAYYRSVIFEWGMKNLWSSPVFGIGLKDWTRPEWMGSASVDNFWLLMAMRYGIPGFLFLATGYALGVIQIMWRDFDGNARLILIRRAWVFTFLGLSFTLCTVHIWSNVYSFVFFMFGAGMWMIHAPNDITSPQQDVPSEGPGPGETLPRSASTYTRFPGVVRGGAPKPALRTR